jgi:hypothetical protein
VVAAALSFGWPVAPAAGQQTGRVDVPKWEVEVHAGGLFVTNPSSGTPIREFPVGETLAPTNTYRAVSSWYFGDGSRILNQANSSFGVAARIVPLDDVLKRRLADRGHGGTFGFRVSRALSPRYAAEFSFDYSRTPLRLRGDVENAVEASRQSFIPAWNGLLATGATSNRIVTSTNQLNGDDGHRLFATGAVRIRLGTIWRLEPYATLGGGGVFNRGAPQLTLVGNYRFTFGPTAAPADETDRVTIRVTEPDQSFVGVLGGGFTYPLSSRQGLRVDLRLHLGGGAVNTVVDAQPAVAVRTPALFTVTGVGIQFSNNPSTLRSSLSGPAIDSLPTFTGEGQQVQTNLSAGYFFRFGPASRPAMRAAGARGAAQGRSPGGRKWEVEGHGGWLGASDVTDGTAIDAFPVGETFPALAGTSSRAVSSWYFGDGATLIAQVHTAANRPSRITPLDSLLRNRLATRGGGGSFGFRVSRQLTSRFSAEFNVDRAATSLDLADGVESALEATRASFIPVFQSAFPPGELAVTSVLAIDRGGDHWQRFVTGAVNIHVGTFVRVAPYVAAGAGAVFNDGVAPVATLTGRYRSSPIPTVVWDETDTVKVHAVIRDHAFVTVLGGGARIHVSSRHGIRVDLRVHLLESPIDTTIDATPSRGPGGTLNATAVVATTPALQFASGPTTTSRSSLSGPVVAGLETFTGTGTQAQLGFSIGYFVRF